MLLATFATLAAVFVCAVLLNRKQARQRPAPVESKAGPSFWAPGRVSVHSFTSPELKAMWLKPAYKAPHHRQEANRD